MSQLRKPVYLDYNATTPVDEAVQKEICSVLKNEWGNPSSAHKKGYEAKEVIQKARKLVGDMIGALNDEEIIFTSGGTESNNMVIHSVLEHYKQKLSSSSDNYRTPHIITTNVEHDSIRLPLLALDEKKEICVTFVPVSKKTGIVDVNDIVNEIRPSTVLVTVMLANNETGVLQPVSELKRHIQDSGVLRDHKLPLYIHTDASQAIGKVEVNVQELEVDYLTIAGHKFYGPRIGALYCRKNKPLCSVFYGGGQERGYRPGTENTPMIAGLGKAAELVTHNLHRYERHMGNMKTYLETKLKSEFQDCCVVFDFSPVLPNTVSVAFNVECNQFSGKKLLSAASGIYASTGAACHSENESSSVLIASGVPSHLADKTLRLTIGRETTTVDIDAAVNELKCAFHQVMR